MDALAQDIDLDLFYAYLWAIALAMSRMAGVLSIFPLLIRIGIRGFVRNAITLAIVLPVIPFIASELVLEPLPPMTTLLVLVLKELFVGFLLGFLVSLPIYAMQMAGNMLDMQRGAMMAQVTTVPGAESYVLGNFFALLIMVYLMASGAFLLLLDGYFESLLVWPPTSFLPSLPSGDLGRVFVVADRLMSAAVLIAAPIIIIMLIIDVGLAIMARFAPSINIFILGLGIKSLVIFIILPLYVVLMSDHMNQLLATFGVMVPELRVLLQSAGSGT